ncbi:MAG TPA: hypothetical protein ENK55_08820 [Actinobacteria bacterium]|nr:hypothetical protein [Actinomycetota bacterium]
MSRNPFEALFRVRAIRERQARAEMGRARLAQQEAYDRLQELKRSLEDTPGLPGNLTPTQLRALQLTGITSHERLLEASAAYEEAHAVHEHHVARWRATDAELEAADRLRQKKKEAAAYRAIVATERAMDDLLLSLRARRRR